MNDETRNPLYMALLRANRNKNAYFRRKKRFAGKDWTPGILPDLTRGVWCPECRIVRPYNGYGKVLCEYEKRGDKWVFMWVCPVCTAVIGELGGDSNARPSLFLRDQDRSSGPVH
jgi:hypothetical protein